MDFHVRIGEPAEVQAMSGEALRAFLRAAREEPGDADYDYILGEALLRAGRGAEAAERYRDAVRLDRENPDYHLALGRALWHLGRFEEAEPSFREAVRLRSDAPALNAHGATLLRLMRFKEAERLLQDALRADGELIDAYGNLAAVLWELDRRGEAITVLRRGCRKAPSDRAAHRNLGVALLESGAATAAVEAFRTAVACVPDDASAHLDLAEALAAAGRGEAAGAAIAEAARLDPGAIAARPAALQARSALRLRELSRDAENASAGPHFLARSLAHIALHVLHATSWLRPGGRVTGLLAAAPLVALAWAGFCVGPHWIRHHLLVDDVSAVARAPVDDDANVRDRLAHAVAARDMEAWVDAQRCIVRTQAAWRRITCAYSVPVEVLPGWTHTLAFQIDVEQPFLATSSAPRN
jgi:tetratricopeptide (TPR) repeat protein